MVKHRTKGPTRAQKAAEVRRLKAAAVIFLAFHEGTSWAHDKLRSGTAALTPEAVEFMQREISRRKDIQAHTKALEKENKALDLAAKVRANAEAEL